MNRTASTAIVFIACGLVARAASAAPRYGLIEIGGKGVKAYSFDLDRAAHDKSCTQSEEANLKCLAVETLNPIDINPSKDPDFAETTKAVEQLAGELGTKGIPADRLYAVLSSSMSKDEARADQLIGRLKADKALTLKHPVDRIDENQEAIFGLNGALGLLPDNVRDLRASQAAIVDIGSGNIKGGYTDGKSEYTFDVGYGTNNSVDAIEKVRGGDSFAAAADKWRKSVFAPALRPELERRQGVTNRNRVYLIGGIVWALATMTHPGDKTQFLRLDAKSIDDMVAKASALDNDLCSDARKQAYADVASVCKRFSPNQMVAGFQLLKGLSEELNFVKAKKVLFFFRPLYVWPLGYVRSKINIDK